MKMMTVMRETSPRRRAASVLARRLSNLVRTRRKAFIDPTLTPALSPAFAETLRAGRHQRERGRGLSRGYDFINGLFAKLSFKLLIDRSGCLLEKFLIGCGDLHSLGFQLCDLFGFRVAEQVSFIGGALDGCLFEDFLKIFWKSIESLQAYEKRGRRIEVACQGKIFLNLSALLMINT